MKLLLIRFAQRAGENTTIPWHFSFYKDILESQGHVVDIIDNQVENHPIGQLVDIVKTGKHELVGTGGMGSVYGPLKSFTSALKREKPDVWIVAGGQIVADYEFILRSCPVDILVLGEGEITLSKIVNALDNGQPWKNIPGIAFLKNGQTIRTKPERLIRLDDLPDFNFGNLDLHKYNTEVSDVFLVDERARDLKNRGHKHILLFIARGCPYRCFFCYRQLPGHRTFSRDRLEQIIRQFKRNHYSFFTFADECLSANEKYLHQICQLAKKYEFYWLTGGARVDHVNPNLIRTLKEHNCVQLVYGVESFDQDMLAAMNKGTTPKQNIDALNWTYQHGISSVLQLILGPPGENRKTILNTRKGIWSCYSNVDRVAVAVLNPYPGSPAYQYAIDQGLITDKGLAHSEFGDKTKIVVNLSKLSRKELAAWRDWLVLEAHISYRVKNGHSLRDRSFLSRLKKFVRWSYVPLMREPKNFLLFTYYLLKGFQYWLKPSPKLQPTGT